MNANKNGKWSTSTSVTKLLSRITRTLSFVSKKSSKKTNKIVEGTQSIQTNTFFEPKSVPVIRRNQAQSYPKHLEKYRPSELNNFRHGVHVVMCEEDEEDEDEHRYSLRPNLSLFNVSVDNIGCQFEEYSQTQDFDSIFHSTKIEH